MIISLGTLNLTPPHDKSSREIRKIRDIPQMNKGNYCKFKANINLMERNSNAGTEKGCPLFPYLFSIVLEVLARHLAIREQKEIKQIQIHKEEGKVSLFADDITTYLSDPQNSASTTDKYFKQST